MMRLWYTKMTYSWTIISLVMDTFLTVFVYKSYVEFIIAIKLQKKNICAIVGITAPMVLRQ